MSTTSTAADSATAARTEHDDTPPAPVRPGPVPPEDA